MALLDRMSPVYQAPSASGLTSPHYCNEHGSIATRVGRSAELDHRQFVADDVANLFPRDVKIARPGGPELEVDSEPQ